MKDIIKPKILFISAICVLLITIGVLKFAFPLRTPLERYQSRFGYSLKGLNVDVEELYVSQGFTDFWGIYSVSVEGGLSGTIFDEQAMQEGLPELQQSQIKWVNRRLNDDGKPPVLVIDDVQEFRYKEFDSVEGSGSSRLYVIKALRDGSYYVIYES